MSNIPKTKKPRHQDWNYGGPKWKLSRSKIDLFIECPRCFYIDNKLGLARPKFPAFLLNTAVDILLKKEFDNYRSKEEPHPIMSEYKVDAIPMKHPKLDEWRENFVGVQFVHEPTGMTISGAVDDLWINPKGEVHVVDYKSTSKDEEITLDDEWKEGYKRQMEVYQWLLRQSGLEVSETGYFVYANAKLNSPDFNEKLDFEVTLIPYKGNPEWVEPTISKIKEVLDRDEIPESGEKCEYCPYCNSRNQHEK